MTTVTELLGGPQSAGVWNLDRERSRATFKNRTLWGIAGVKGTFDDLSGDGQVTASGGVFGRIDIRAASLKTGIGKRDEHLKSADFFDVERFPQISVVVTAAKLTTDHTVDLRATLSVKGTTRPLEVPATITVLDDGAVRVTAKITIKRADFDVTGNQLGMVGQVTRLAADAVFVRAD